MGCLGVCLHICQYSCSGDTLTGRWIPPLPKTSQRHASCGACIAPSSRCWTLATVRTMTLLTLSTLNCANGLVFTSPLLTRKTLETSALSQEGRPTAHAGSGVPLTRRLAQRLD